MSRLFCRFCTPFGPRPMLFDSFNFSSTLRSSSFSSTRYGPISRKPPPPPATLPSRASVQFTPMAHVFKSDTPISSSTTAYPKNLASGRAKFSGGKLDQAKRRACGRTVLSCNWRKRKTGLESLICRNCGQARLTNVSGIIFLGGCSSNR